jgi:hypothetical protein
MVGAPSATADLSSNWVADVNRFNLPKPPAWFLKILWDQDAALVVLPSRQGRKYLVGRRRERSRIVAGITQAVLNEKVHQHVPYSDSAMLESYRLVKVDAITSITGNAATGSWMTSSPEILKDLRDRDMWSAGGADAYIAKIEGEEAALVAEKRAKLLDDIDHRARDAWRSLQARTGQRNHHAGNHKSAVKVIKSPLSSSTAGSGLGSSAFFARD